MTHRRRTDLTLAIAILALGLLLAFAGHLLVAQWLGAAGHKQHLDFAQLLGLAAYGSGLALVAWWLLSLSLAVMSAILQRAGRLNGAAIVAKFSPNFMLRLTVAFMSMNLLGVGAAHASSAPPAPGWQPSQASPASSWRLPLDAGVGAQPTDAPTTDQAVEVHDPRWRPQAPVVDPGLLSRQASRPEGPDGEIEVIVTSGDSLWSIVATKLGPMASDVDVALAWPKWYSTNRTIIGNDPSVLVPGQVLRPPASG